MSESHGKESKSAAQAVELLQVNAGAGRNPFDNDISVQEVTQPEKPAASTSTNPAQTQNPVKPPLTDEELLEADLAEEKDARFWQIIYYRSFFRVTTKDVLSRLFFSFVPYPGLFWRQIEVHPDLYGPFWVNTTLIIALGISANFASYIDWYFDNNADHSDGNDDWAYDLSKVVAAAAIIYFYAALLTFYLYFVTPVNQVNMKFMHICCIVGYSMTVYIPMAIIAAFPHSGIRWAAIIFAYLISGALLAISFWEPVQFHSRTWGIIALSFALLAHFGIALAFRFYFFDY